MKKNTTPFLRLGLCFLFMFFILKNWSNTNALVFHFYLSSNHDITSLQQGPSDKPKTVLYWKHITPYVVMQEVCNQERMILLYSELKDLVLSVNSIDILPKEMVDAHELTRKRASIDSTISVQMVYRYAFCIKDSVKSFIIKNNLYESLPVDMEKENFPVSRNIGLITEADIEYLDMKAEAIERAETQRSLTIESIKTSFEALSKQNSDIPENTLVIDANTIAYTAPETSTIPETANTIPVQPQISSTPEVNEVQDVVELPVIEETTAVPETEPSNTVIEQKEEKPNYSDVMTSITAKEFYVMTLDDESIAFDPNDAILDGNGNGYKVQIIAKLKDDHDANSIQKYYRLPYAVEEHYDGTWHRFTLKNYSGNWEETYERLLEIRKNYGIADAFISLYQNAKRMCIFPCSQENNMQAYESSLAEGESLPLFEDIVCTE